MNCFPFVPSLNRLLLLGFLVLLAACSAPKTVTIPEQGGPRAASGIDESFDPVNLMDEDIEFPESIVPAMGEDPATTTAAATTKINSSNQLVDGFRVQLFASKDIEKATLEQKEAEYMFLDDSVAVYVKFESPMYKVRVGDCRSRDDAEKLQGIARRKGYPSAWIVPTKVNSMGS